MKFEVIYVDSFCTCKIQLIVSLNKVLYKHRCQRLRAIALALKNLASTISLRMIELITYKCLGHRKNEWEFALTRWSSSKKYMSSIYPQKSTFLNHKFFIGKYKTTVLWKDLVIDYAMIIFYNFKFLINRY